MSATRLLTRCLRPKRSNETAVLAEVVGAADEDFTPRPLRIELGHGPVSARYPLRLNLERSAKPEECYRARDIRSASASAIYRTAAIHRRSRGTDAGGHRRARDRPRAQNDTRSYSAANGIGDILAVDDGASLFRARGDQASHQEGEYYDREFHFDLPGVGGAKCAPGANRSSLETNRQRTCEAGDGPSGPVDTDQGKLVHCAAARYFRQVITATHKWHWAGPAIMSVAGPHYLRHQRFSTASASLPPAINVIRNTSKITAVDQPNSSTPFIAVIGPSRCQRSTGVTSP
jgi:hypothetical protein